SSGQYENYQAIWFQITILFVSFYFYINTSYQLYFLKRGKIELSKFKLNFFTKVIVSKDQIFEKLAESIEKSNKQIQIEKAKHSANLRKKK
uniref:hypothetical protein n=1 Tax=Vibrio sp. V23_P3S9T160 TaxID=1938675 RepID=UPI001F170706